MKNRSLCFILHFDQRFYSTKFIKIVISLLNNYLLQKNVYIFRFPFVLHNINLLELLFFVEVICVEPDESETIHIFIHELRHYFTKRFSHEFHLKQLVIEFVYHF